MVSPEPEHTACRLVPLRALVCLVSLFLVTMLPQSARPESVPAGPAPPQPKVLILYGASTNLPAHGFFNNGLLSALEAAGVDDLHQHQEYLDLQRRHGSTYRRDLADYLRTKYEDDSFDAIVLFQPDALHFMLQEGKELFAGTPIVAAIPTGEIDTSGSGRRVVQLVYSFDSLTTLRYALTLLPDTKEIIVIGGPTAADDSHLRNALEALKQFEGKVAIRSLTNHAMPDILKEVAAESDRAIILYTRLSRDAAGTDFIPRAALTQISRAASSPVFGLHDSLLGFGIVGGSLLSFQEVGRDTARLCVDLLQNRLDPRVSQVRFEHHTPMFDWAEMQRWRLDRSRLPKGRVLINYHPGLWEEYWGYALGALLFLAVEATLIAGLLVSRRRRIATETALRESEQRYRTVAEFTSDWEYWISPDRTVRYVSPSCKKVSGYTPDEFYADPELLTRVVHPDDLHRFAGHLHALTDQNEPEHLDFRIVTKDGDCRWVSHVCRSVYGADGEPLGQRASNRDITERKRAEEKVRQLNDELESRVRERTAELERSNRELEGFCHAISHEFRAPIARLEGFCTLLLELAGEEGEQSLLHCARRIVAASNRLRTVVDALLTMTRLSRAEMVPQRLDLSAMAAEIVAELLEDAGERAICVSIAPDVTATGDREMLAVCLRNLLGNAIQYSSEAREASVEFGQLTMGGETVYFVKDNGVGFDMKYARNIFQPFCRIHSGAEFEGSGVGLATVHRILEKHKGRIWTEATPGEGATFFFTIGGGREGATG